MNSTPGLSRTTSVPEVTTDSSNAESLLVDGWSYKKLAVSYLSLGHPDLVNDASATTLCLLILGWVFAVIVLGLAVVYWVVRTIAPFPRPVEESEETYVTVVGKEVSEARPLPKITDEASLFLSVVIPAYNETERLPIMLEETVKVLREWKIDGKSVTWEILLVDDGSKDQTVEVGLTFASENNVPENQFRVCQLVKNRGKGGAVTHGMQRCRGEYIIFADADGASEFSDVKNLYGEITQLNSDWGRIALGSRAHMVSTDAVVKRSLIRNLLMYGLHTLLYIFGIRSIGDTQCGFKMFDREAVAKIFPFMHTEGWIFDVEVLIIGERKGLAVVEVPISWHEVDGSKMVLARDSIKMAIDLITIRVAYAFGIYRDGSKGTAKAFLEKKEQ
ncbi:nucleotide-diphospho-sugar transferase [Lipomyces oligophaga]|uniref:nucleotide-diphospho-sugar transferase n=1 Tax=Lipomyces oligophaga TaxID=45792 RepID=UPI0034CFC669